MTDRLSTGAACGMISARAPHIYACRVEDAGRPVSSLYYQGVTVSDDDAE